MGCPIWILDRHEDTRLMILESLTHAGMSGIGFGSVEELVAEAAATHFPPAATTFVDAMTALDCEEPIHEALGDHVVVFTTWPTQRAPWMRIGVSRFLMKPFDLGVLCELARPTRPTLAKCGLPAHLRPWVDYCPAAPAP
jgi:hypothetical protein